MNRDLSDMREHYDLDKLEGASILSSPFDLFDRWFSEANKADLVQEPNAFTLATINKDNYPDARVLLLKEYNKEGFVFYTNYDSRKGQDIAANPKVSALFLWKAIHRQVRILGEAVKIDSEASRKYFLSRPKESQLGAWASQQSTELTSREILEKQFQDLEEQYKNEEIPLPKHWGGYVIKPVRIEFWQGRTSRLHDRIEYSLIDGSWDWKRLYP